MVKPFKVFKNIFKQMLDGCNTKKVDKKFKNITRCYVRSRNRFRKMRSYLSGRGLDVGSADCGLIILAKIYGITIDGMDCVNSEFKDMHRYLNERGYTIFQAHINDTDYDFLSGEYNYIILYGVIYQLYQNSPGDKPTGFENRMLSLIRHTAQGGIWFINSSIHTKMILRRAKLRDALKNKGITIKGIKQ